MRRTQDKTYGGRCFVCSFYEMIGVAFFVFALFFSGTSYAEGDVAYIDPSIGNPYVQEQLGANAAAADIQARKFRLYRISVGLQMPAPSKEVKRERNALKRLQLKYKVEFETKEYGCIPPVDGSLSYYKAYNDFVLHKLQERYGLEKVKEIEKFL